MRKVSFICLWAFIVFLVLSFLFGIAAAILQFMMGNIAGAFSDLLWTCICGWIIAATIGIKANDKVVKTLDCFDDEVGE